MKLTCNKSAPTLGGVLFAEHVTKESSVGFDLEWGSETVIEHDGKKIMAQTTNDVCRIIAKLLDEKKYYGSSIVEKTAVDSWLTFSTGPLGSREDFNEGLQHLNRSLGTNTYLVGKRLTIADFVVFAVLYVSKQWQKLLLKKEAPIHVLRWYHFINAIPSVGETLLSLPDDAKTAPTGNRRASLEKTTVGGRAQEGKFVELPGAEMGKVVVRFPPEASGYLHIGHAKAALLNQYYQQAFDGKLIMRFDDTNPAKENIQFEKVILQDVCRLKIVPDRYTHTSDYFDLMLEYCETMLKEGKAYCDDTPPELMKEQREQKIESGNRSNAYEKNLEMWQEMVKGSAKGQQCCVRAKIDMQNPNGCLRDPTIYRCKNERHPRTGDKYKVYPTYDFACPIVDAIEGVTHTLRTMEYHDRDAQFYWFIDALGLRRPYIWEYSRLSMTNTVLSKRKLTWFVEEGLVDGWNDPRMPTVQGVLRRGMTVEGLRQFIIAQGSSRSVVFMEWDKIWSINKKVIDPIAPRYTAIDHEEPVPVLVKDAKEEKTSVPKHPKNEAIGNKDVWVGPRILIDRADAESLKEGENTTFINWGNLTIKNVNRQNGKIISIDAVTNLENKDYKKTVKLTWLADTPKAPFTPTWCVYFDHIISKPLLGKDEDFKQFVGHDTRREVQMLGDPELMKLQRGEIIQLQRKGFFRVDEPYRPPSEFTGVEQPVILFYVPDGHTKETPTSNVSASKVQTKANEASIPLNKKSDSQINDEIIKQGEVVRNLKSQKAPKTEIEEAVKLLLALKAEYKTVTNADWKPGSAPVAVKATPNIEGSSTEQKDEVNAGSKSATQINEEIVKQGEIVRNLKSQKAAKPEIEGAVKMLLALKAEYKTATNVDWKPGCVPPEPTVPKTSGNVEALNKKIAEQGDKVRKLKMDKADKTAVDAAVKALLELKAEYKEKTGKAWTPSVAPRKEPSPPKVQAGGNGEKVPKIPTGGSDENVMSEKITELNSKVNDLKSAHDTAVKALSELKASFKTTTGKDWKPGMVPVKEPVGGTNENVLLNEIALQGDKIRVLKAEKADKATTEPEIKKLLSLKADFKTATGKDWKPGMQPAGVASEPPAEGAPGKTTESKPKEQKQSKPKEKIAKPKTVAKDKKSVEVEEGLPKKQTRLCVEAKKEENLADWYSQVITKGEMIEYYAVSGCYVLLPWSKAVWNSITTWLDGEIKKLGVKDCSYPMFVPKSALEKEKTHIADFAPEVAWVTKSGDSELAEPIAIRPTSETVIYPSFAKRIQSHRQLPIKENQWCTVVRWEFKQPQPFLRSREFHWQEGHTVYADPEEAKEEVGVVLDLYARIYTDLLAVPVVKGRKTEKEKFAGGDFTYTAEAYISASGRAIQGATSHHLGQNFSKMFEIVFESQDTQKKYAYQNSWGITTRTIGVMIMVHSDNKGLVLPPQVATVQVVIVPCGINVNLSETDHKELQASCDSLESELKMGGIRTTGDYRDYYSPGWKFNHWELKGVPIRVELGPKDMKNKQIVAVRRDTGEKIVLKRETAVKDLSALLQSIQQNLYNNALKDLEDHTVTLTSWDQFGANLDKKNIILAPFCGNSGCEDKIKADSARDDSEAIETGAPSMGAKSLCIPLEQPADIKASDKCIHPDCERKPQFYTLFGRSY